MTINAIIEQLYNSKEVDDCIKKMVRVDHQQDFKQELFIILYEKPAGTIIDLHEKGGLKWYVVRIILNLVNQERNVYHKTYNHPLISYDSERIKEATVPPEAIEEGDREKREAFELSVLNEYNGGMEEAFGTFYYKKLFDLVMEKGSMREVSRMTAIPIASISEAIKKVRNYLKNKCYNDSEQIKGIY